VLRLPYPGLTHPDRAELALAVLIRYGGAENDPIVAPIRSLLAEPRLVRARGIGLALRLAQTVSGGAPGLLSQTRLKRTEKTLIFVPPLDATVFLSEAVERRFGRLARAMGLRPQIVSGRP
jgi:exopolyphosphatase/guanosine-5'-triphosphate,3'-diphosphate pyrophosphatase